ncbi:MAG: hypothetical protein IPJ76_00895 [Flavobacteriales bacterium]|nr:MAG: hypothetical protein IPJ76_00895 [Flavobacteriales bacterium]
MKQLFFIFFASAVAACSGGSDHLERALADVATADRLDAVRITEAHVGTSAEGLLGKWESVQDSGRTVFNEQWERAGEHSLKGIGYVMTGPDTVFVEHLSLDWDGIPTYTVRTPSQNGNEQVHFTLRKGCCDEGNLIFENPTHDWPQTIAYTRTATGWTAVVSGKEKNMEREARFDFVPRKGTLAAE